MNWSYAARTLKKTNKPQTKEIRDSEKFSGLLELSIRLTIRLTGNLKFLLGSAASPSSLRLHHDSGSHLESEMWWLPLALLGAFQSFLDLKFLMHSSWWGYSPLSPKLLLGFPIGSASCSQDWIYLISHMASTGSCSLVFFPQELTLPHGFVLYFSVCQVIYSMLFITP